jgi:signal transduction histidine kinase
LFVKYYKMILPVLFFAALEIRLQAQTINRYNTFSYNVNEGLLQSTITDMEFDKNNFCWISFPNGIQKFDGKNFITVPAQPGLPDDKFVKFFKCRNGDLLLTHTEGISKYEISKNTFTVIYKNSTGVTKPVDFIGEDGDIIYFYTETGTIKGINSTTYELFSETKTNLPASSIVYTIKFSDNIINHRVGVKIDYKLYLWDLKLNRLLATSDIIPDISPYFLHLKTENEVLYLTYKINNAFQLYNFATGKNSKLFVNGKDDKPIGRCHILPWKNKLLVFFTNRLFETDTSFTLLKTELVDFQNQAIGGISGVSGIKEDNYSNLYIQTVSSGIKKIIGNNYPVKYYGTQKKEDNIIISLLPDKKNNRILAGTARNGLLVFDTLQRLIKHIKTLPGKNMPFSTNTIIKNNRGDYLLFNVSEKQVWVLKNDLSSMASIPITSTLPENKKGMYYFGNFLFQNETGAITQTQGKLFKTNFTTNAISEYEVSTAYIMGGLLHNNFIITHGNDELIFLDAATFALIKKIPFKNTGNIRCFTHDKENNIYAGSNNGIFKIDSNGKILQHLTKENGLPDNCIYAILFDEAGFLWCSTNKGIFRMNKDNSIFQLKKEDGLQENEFNTNVAAKSDDGEFFFGGVNGVSSFYPSSISNFDEKINLFFTRIKANNEPVIKDTAMWAIDKIILPYQKNYLSFDFTAMGLGNPEQYIYQYKMEGIDEEWIKNNDLQTVRYSLPPGEYVLKIYASRLFDKSAKPMKEINIIVSPPFWKTWWFFTSIALLLITLLVYTINWYNKNKYQKKLTELEGEHKIQLERERISRDLHDSIGAYANAVLYNTELLQKEEHTAERNELMNDLKFASKDIITSLRETIWALKKENYTAEDCLLRIKNFIQPLAQYYSHIKFTAEGQAPAAKELHYAKALNVVRIVQEAVTNAIKHASAKNISITSKEENGKWNLIIADDGLSFDYKKMKDFDQGNGLNNMKQRSIESGFEISIESVKGTGTKINLLV